MDAPFRVRVRLERFFSDERARVLLCVSARRRVRWLARRLRARFALPRLVLLSAGHLLPPWESLGVLARDDVVDALPAALGEDSGVGDLDAAASAGDPPAADGPKCGDAVDSGAASEPLEDDELREHKRRALLQLEAMVRDGGESAAPEGAAPEEAARGRRRRVRRRRRGDAPYAAGGAERGASVLRNEDTRARAPRVVHSLDGDEAASA